MSAARCSTGTATREGYQTAFIRGPTEWRPDDTPEPQPDPSVDPVADGLGDLATQLRA